jgi:hypothetical protein
MVSRGKAERREGERGMEFRDSSFFPNEARGVARAGWDILPASGAD